jgi:AraC-like DNA-binding protein
MTAVTLAALVLATYSAYQTFEKRLVTRIHDSSQQLLKQTNSIFSAIHSSYIPYFIQLSYDPRISELMYGTEIPRLEILKGTEALNRAQLSLPYLHSVMAYNYREQMVYSALRAPTPVQEFEDQDVIRILENIRDYRLYRYIPRTLRLDPGRGPENVLTVLVGQAPFRGRRSLGALIFNLSERALREQLLGRSDEFTAKLGVVGRDGTVLSHPDRSRFGSDAGSIAPLATVISSDEQRGTFRTELDGTSHWVTHVTDEVMGWHFVAWQPASDVTKQLVALRNQLIIGIALLILGLLVVDFVASKSLSRPVERLFRKAQELQTATESRGVTFTSEGTPVDSHRAGGEIDGLRQILEQSHSEMQKAGRLKISAHLLALLEGRDELTDPRELPAEIRTFLSRGCVRPVSILVDNAVSLRAQYGRDYLNSVRRIVESLIPEVFALPTMTVDMGHDQVGLLVAEAAEEQFDELQRTIAALQRRVTERLDTTISAGIGPTESDANQLRDAYQAAAEAARGRFAWGHETLAYSERDTGSSSELYRFPEDEVGAMVDAMLLGHREEALKKARIVIYSTKERTYADFVLMKERLSYTLFRLLYRRLDSTPELGLDFDRFAEDHRWVDTLSRLERLLEESVDHFIASRETHSSDRRAELAEDARRYIEEHLTESTLCADEVAESLGISTNYLRNLFKRHIGDSVYDYINTRRVDLAKERLRSGDLSVKAVVERCGFSNYTYFFTVFKKHTGTTPKQYLRNEAFS